MLLGKVENKIFCHIRISAQKGGYDEKTEKETKGCFEKQEMEKGLLPGRRNVAGNTYVMDDGHTDWGYICSNHIGRGKLSGGKTGK